MTKITTAAAMLWTTVTIEINYIHSVVAFKHYSHLTIFSHYSVILFTMYNVYSVCKDWPFWITSRFKLMLAIQLPHSSPGVPPWFEHGAHIVVGLLYSAFCHLTIKHHAPCSRSSPTKMQWCPGTRQKNQDNSYRDLNSKACESKLLTTPVALLSQVNLNIQLQSFTLAFKHGPYSWQ